MPKPGAFLKPSPAVDSARDGVFLRSFPAGLIGCFPSERANYVDRATMAASSFEDIYRE